MERNLRQILAFGASAGLIFVTDICMAAPVGMPQDYRLKTNYLCQTNGAVVRYNQQVVSNGGRGVQEFKFSAFPGRNQTLTFGNREYKIWPRVTGETFEKTLNVLARDEKGQFQIVQEIGLGNAQKTKTNVALTVKRGTDDEKPVTCKIEMEWIKKKVASDSKVRVSQL
jgi:hypothetical protein